MREYGSDFHYIEQSYNGKKTITSLFPSANYYADGRQALIHLYQSKRWERLWVPEYFCYDVIESLLNAGLVLKFYSDWPDYHEDSETLETIRRKRQFKSSDAILRVNYFGTRAFRDSEALPVAAVVEDHTHDLIGNWAINSNADWCIASIRKSLPIPEGGLLWSPRMLKLPDPPLANAENEQVTSTRWEAMRLKKQYLAGETVEKMTFRERFLNTESFFDAAPVCALDNKSQEFLRSFDVQEWYDRKRDNWEILRRIHKEGVQVLQPEGFGCNPFSLILMFDIPAERDRVRKELIEKQVYPAILWSIPCPLDGDIYLFSQRMLSIHCDARYSREDILQLKSIIESIL